MRPLLRLATLAAAVALAAPAGAQSFGSAPPRIGVGFDVTGAIPGQDLIPDGVAIGLRVRAALPVNADLSLAASVGLAAHLWDGRADARYVMNPQTSLIVTLPGRGPNVRYVLGGFGGFIPLDGNGGGGPTLHAGIGTAIPLNDTSLYLEVDPSLLIGTNETTLVLSGRVGVIF